MAHAWHPADIKAEIEKRGSNLSQIGRDAGIYPGTPRFALKTPCYVGEQAIAKFLSVSAKTIWPDRYDADGLPLHPRIRRGLFNAANGENPSQKTGAA